MTAARRIFFSSKSHRCNLTSLRLRASPPVTLVDANLDNDLWIGRYFKKFTTDDVTV